MNEFLAKFNGEELFILIGIVGGVLIAVISIVATQWRRVRITEMELSLKLQMVEKGMSAAEIEQVMKASNVSATGVSSTGVEALDRATLAQRMVENGYEGQDIERVLKAYQPTPKQPAENLTAPRP